jgi:hypothetical protein
MHYLFFDRPIARALFASVHHTGTKATGYEGMYNIGIWCGKIPVVTLSESGV